MARPIAGTLPVAQAALLLAALAGAGCVMWPAGSGPNAGPIPAAEALAMRDRGQAVIFDVRPLEDYVQGHVPGALRIDGSEVEARAASIRRLGRLPILYCGWPNEASSTRAVLTLQAKGIDARVLQDGLDGYLATGRPLATGADP